jgi:ParB family chromosome partitioning protein
MAKNSIDAYGAAGKTNLLFFDPEALELVTDENSPVYDPRVHLPVNEDLARNIDYQGVLEPISVIKNTESGKIEVVVGRQRTKAARLVNEWRRERGMALIQIPATIYRRRRQEALDAIVSENELREADSPLGRAEKMRRMLALGRGEDEIAIVFGCKPATVKSTLMLLDCCSAVQQAVESGKVNVTHARQLARLDPAEQREKVQELIAAGDGATGHAKSRKQRAVMGDAQPRMKSRSQITKELEAAQGERAEVSQ